MSKPFMQYDVADFSNTNIENKSLAEIRRDSYTEGFMKGKLEGRAEAIDEIKELAHEDVTTGNLIISLSDVEKLKEQSND